MARQISYEEANAFAEQKGFQYIEINSENGYNCEQLLKNAAQQIIESKQQFYHDLMGTRSGYVCTQLKQRPSTDTCKAYWRQFFAWLFIFNFFIFYYIIGQLLLGITLLIGNVVKQVIVAISMMALYGAVWALILYFMKRYREFYRENRLKFYTLYLLISAVGIWVLYYYAQRTDGSAIFYGLSIMMPVCFIIYLALIPIAKCIYLTIVIVGMRKAFKGVSKLDHPEKREGSRVEIDAEQEGLLLKH
ncbi:hypothetical protein FGO68_gene4270 [Halteria grandinella]|uniref:Uncharacterized protein n=1 Tax=Halteria grandinella TaxID=5974 RepID=A0A8J8NN04_HALGN|nr:hypothetical protein FGO68_gene4270 [Halteria grandinella]